MVARVGETPGKSVGTASAPIPAANATTTAAGRRPSFAWTGVGLFGLVFR